MITYVVNPETKALEIVQEKPRIVSEWTETIPCFQPDPCPGCGNCLICDSKCMCGVNARCSLANLCNTAGHCLRPAHCTDIRPAREL